MLPHWKTRTVSLDVELPDSFSASKIVPKHGGPVVEFNGDGMMAVFGALREPTRKERAADLILSAHRAARFAHPTRSRSPPTLASL